ncbi:hypothetical protein JCM30471_28900 [Desulfuromonas carbonis]
MRLAEPPCSFFREEGCTAHSLPKAEKRLASFGGTAGPAQGVLANVPATDFLQAIALLNTTELRLAAMKYKPGKESEWPAVRATRQSLLDLPLAAYKKYRDVVRLGFERSAKSLRQQQVHRVNDLPYQSQLVPLAAIFADIGEKAEHTTNNEKIARWYWCGVFGELYGSAAETRFAKDIMRIPMKVASRSSAKLPLVPRQSCQ